MPDQFYVRAGAGNDSNDGSGPASALRTIGAAVGRLSDGDTVIVGPGVYNEAVVDPRTGTANNPIVLRGDPTGVSTGDEPGLVLIDATGVLGPDDRPLPGIRLSGVEFVEVDGFSVKGGSTAGIQIRGRGRDELVGSRQVTIRNCQVFDGADGRRRLPSGLDDVLLFNNASSATTGAARGRGSPRVSLINTRSPTTTTGSSSPIATASRRPTRSCAQRRAEQRRAERRRTRRRISRSPPGR